MRHMGRSIYILIDNNTIFICLFENLDGIDWRDPPRSIATDPDTSRWALGCRGAREQKGVY